MAAATLPPQIETNYENPKRFSRDEVQEMLDADMFGGQRIELIDGELIDKMGQNPPHSSTIRLALEWLVALFGLARMRIQAPIEVARADRSSNFPEPDIAVLVEIKADYARRHPLGNELTLAVEVSETSLGRDKRAKRDLYARAGVPEYWIIDLMGRQIIVHRALSQGTYTQVLTFSENESIALQSEPGKPIAVSALLPSSC